MNRNKFASTLLLVGLATVMSGCDNHSYHSYNGNSGFRFKTISSDSYAVEYLGTVKNSQKDVEVMWHHAARELCRGSGYENNLMALHSDKLGLGNEVVPKQAIRYRLEGEVICLAPNIALKRLHSPSFSDDLTTDQLISGRTSD